MKNGSYAELASEANRGSFADCVASANVTTYTILTMEIIASGKVARYVPTPIWIIFSSSVAVLVVLCAVACAK
jgi:hypothetical protein